MKPATQRKTAPETKPTLPASPRAAEPAATAPRPAATPAPPATVKALKTKTELPKPVLAPTREAIARRAYELYVARGQAHGHDAEDWTRAERELAAPSHRNN
jgi:hypothetical protein